MKQGTKLLALTLSGGSFALSRLLTFRVQRPNQTALIMPKLIVDAAALYLGAASVVGGVAGLFSRSRKVALVSSLLATAGAAAYAEYIQQLLSSRSDFERVFGAGWEANIPAEMQRYMLPRRLALRMPSVSAPRWQRDVPFWSIPGRDKPLLCDIWQPPAGTPPSGLAVLYFHGSAWHYLDKDFLTRPLFRHLAAQGHVVMDVAYRLCPEVAIHEMVGDVKRAVAWMKQNANRYGVNPKKIVLVGSSAGGHIALMAAYADNNPDFTPSELRDTDTMVQGVISYYGPVDLGTMYTYELNTTGTGEPDPNRPKNAFSDLGDKLTRRIMGASFEPVTLAQTFADLLGEIPDHAPKAAEAGSPLSYVRADCPPTLLLHGEHDTLVPVTSTRTFYDRLQEAGAPVIYREFPLSEHGFDLFLASIALPGLVALYDTERFLALLAAGVKVSKASEQITTEQKVETPYG